MNSLNAESVKQGSCPYDDLFIYYLTGRIRDGGPAFEGLIGNWEEEDTTFLFFSAPATELVNRLIAAQPQLTLVDQYKMSYDQWQGDALKSFDIGGFRIVSPWQPAAEKEDEKASRQTLMLDPGVVFGTGTHPTTHDCLAALELLCAEAPPRDVLDLGTGTGLLAVAAALLGARQVLAVDLNLLAVHTARRNIALNGLEKQVLALQGRAEDFIGMPAELVIANIHFDVMQTLIKAPAFLVGQRFILSGLLRSEAKEVEARLLRAGARIHRTWTHEGTWYTFCGQTAST